MGNGKKVTFAAVPTSEIQPHTTQSPAKVSKLKSPTASRFNCCLKVALCLCTIIAIVFLVSFIVITVRPIRGRDVSDNIATAIAPTASSTPTPANSSTTNPASSTALGLNTSVANNMIVGGVCMSPECVSTASRVLASMNQSARPCDDFYRYACGGWIEKNSISSDKPSVSVFTWIRERNLEVERDLLSENMSTPLGAQASRLFMLCMDTQALDARGKEPVVSLYEDVYNHTFNISDSDIWNQERDSVSLSEMLAKLHLTSVSALFNSGVSTNRYNSSTKSFMLSQGGLSLPSRDYYFRNASSDPALIAFKTFVATTFSLMGVSTADNASSLVAERILGFETRLAEITLPPAALRDPVKSYNVRGVEQLNSECPAINWGIYLSTLYGKNRAVNTTISLAPAYFQNLTTLLSTTSKSTIIEYLQWHVLSSLISFLSEDFRDARSQFNKVLYGIQEDPPWWQVCVAASKTLGYAVGKGFVDEGFSRDGRNAAEEVFNDVANALIGSFANLSWMDNSTAAAARYKASKVIRKIGYPQWFGEPNGLENYYSGLNTGSGGYFEEVLAVVAWKNKKDCLSLFEPVDRTEWAMFPQDVDAYYRPSLNEIVFPAGILQPPFFSADAQQALNYGGIGSIMGHEFSHAFDDQGAQYDADGNLAQWRSNTSYELFRAQTACLVKEYSNFSVRGPSGPVAVNGDLTLEENIADNGGIKAAFTAYRSWVARNSPEPKLPGLDATPEQLFFLGFAQVWCQNSRPDYARLAALTDVHSPARARVNGVVMNSNDFASTFQCPVGSRMNPVEKCGVW